MRDVEGYLALELRRHVICIFAVLRSSFCVYQYNIEASVAVLVQDIVTPEGDVVHAIEASPNHTYLLLAHGNSEFLRLYLPDPTADVDLVPAILHSSPRTSHPPVKVRVGRFFFFTGRSWESCRSNTPHVAAACRLQ